MANFNNINRSFGNVSSKISKKIYLATFFVVLVILSCIFLTNYKFNLSKYWVSFNNDSINLYPKILGTSTSTSPTVNLILEPEIIIEKIGVIVPIILNVDGNNKAQYLDNLKRGVAHFVNSSLPGENGNIFIFGHSSSIESSKYSKIFSRLNDLDINDVLQINYNDQRYTYQVFEKKIISKYDTSVLNKTDKEQLTLMTCWPIGTSLERLVVKSNLIKIEKL